MALSHLLNDRVTLVKKDGRRVENLPASVQSGKIFTNDPTVPIEDGDIFERQTPSGITERFLILDAGFMQAFHSIAAHYQSKVRKSTSPVHSQAPAQNVYNLLGANSRVNIQSSDSSTNVVNVDASALFDSLRQAVEGSISEPKLRQQIREAVDAMQAATGSQTFSVRYKEFIALAADHVSIFAPFLPALTQLLL